MKQLLCIVCLCSFFSTLKAQQDFIADTSRHHEVGVDVSRIAFNLLGTREVPTAAYAVTYKNIRNFRGFRMGVGLSLSGTLQNEDNPSSIDLNTASQNLQVRLGYEWQYPFAKRWLAYVGADGLLGFSGTSSETIAPGSNVKLRRTNISTGGGLALGAQYYINKRLSLGTEAAFYAILGYTRTKTTQGGNFGFTNIVKSWQYFLDTNLPTNVYLIFRF